MRKPRPQDGKFIDVYFEQFSEPTDEPTITVNNENSCYEFPGFVSYKDIDHEVKRMKKDAEWLLKAAAYIEARLIK